MVALMVVATIIGFLLVDIIYRSVKRDSLQEAAQLAKTPLSLVPLTVESLDIPKGLFYHKGHTWIEILFSGKVRVGIDDFVQRVLGRIDKVELPKLGKEVKQGEKVISLIQNGKKLTLVSPVDGVVDGINDELLANLKDLKVDPYRMGWFFSVKPNNLYNNLMTLKIGEEASSWFETELEKLREFVMKQVPVYGTVEAGVKEDRVAFEGLTRLLAEVA